MTFITFVNKCYYTCDLYYICGQLLHLCLQQQILKVVLKDSSSIYEDLLTKLYMTNLEAGRVQSMMVTLYKCLNGMAPSYLRAYVQEWRVSNYNLRGYSMLEIRQVRTSSYGLLSYRYYNPYAWNDLSDDIRKSDTIAGSLGTKDHKRKIIDYIY